MAWKRCLNAYSRFIFTPSYKTITDIWSRKIQLVLPINIFIPSIITIIVAIAQETGLINLAERQNAKEGFSQRRGGGSRFCPPTSIYKRRSSTSNWCLWLSLYFYWSPSGYKLFVLLCLFLEGLDRGFFALLLRRDGRGNINSLSFAISLFLCLIPSEFTLFEKIGDIYGFLGNLMALPLEGGWGDKVTSLCVFAASENECRRLLFTVLLQMVFLLKEEKVSGKQWQLRQSFSQPFMWHIW